MTVETCEITCIHEEQVERAKSKINEVNVGDLSSLFKLLADENRFKILHSLAFEEELCVCDIANIIGATNATTSHHLQSLKKLGVIDSKKQGKLVYYFSVDKRIRELLVFGKELEKEDA
ncbi:MAG: metalloregulator ArsR/SmtB family transcription factor [Vagococcus sp.]|uniref:ArsR/SmtB family transcription factor n=1 Tax=Vagococcus TaxID=2737 RepID=UPI002FCB75FC